MSEIKIRKIYDGLIRGQGKWKNQRRPYRKAGGSTMWACHWASRVRMSGACETLLEHMVIDAWFGSLSMTMTGFYGAITELRCQSPVSLSDPLLLFYMDNLKHRVTGSSTVTIVEPKHFPTLMVRAMGIGKLSWSSTDKCMDWSLPCVRTCKRTSLAG